MRGNLVREGGVDQIEREAAKVETGRGHVRGRAKREKSGTGHKRDPTGKERRRRVAQDPNHVGRERQNAREVGVVQSRWRSRGGRAGKVAGGESHGNVKSRESGGESRVAGTAAGGRSGSGARRKQVISSGLLMPTIPG